jgi:hypothetical protein
LTQAKYLGYDNGNWNWEAEEEVEERDQSYNGSDYSRSDSADPYSDSNSDSEEEAGFSDEEEEQTTQGPVDEFGRTSTTQLVQPEIAEWWSGDGAWEKAGEDDTQRWEFHTAEDGTITIFREAADGGERVVEGTATFDGDTVVCQIFGGEYSAEMDEEGTTLIWCDGDEWTRVSARRAKATRQKKTTKGQASNLRAALKPIVRSSSSNMNPCHLCVLTDD